MRDFKDKRIWILGALLLLLIAFIAALFTVPPFAFVEDVEIEGSLPYSLGRQAERMVGLSRYSSEYRRLRNEILDSGYIEQAKFRFSDGVLYISAVPESSLVVLTDGRRYLLQGKGQAYLPEPGDMSFLLESAPVVEVTAGQLEYIARYGIEKRLSEVIDLILEIYHSSSYNDKLVGKVKYQSGTGEEFGYLRFITASGEASLLLREKADPEMVLKSLSVMNEKARVLPTGEMREYELRGNTLTEQKRIVDGI